MKISGYRIVENDENKARQQRHAVQLSVPAGLESAINISVSSTLDLMHRLIDAVQKESRPPAVRRRECRRSRVHRRDRHHPAKPARLGRNFELFDGIKKQLITRNMLEQGNSPRERRRKISLFLELIDQLGKVETSTRIEPNRYEFNVRIGP